MPKKSRNLINCLALMALLASACQPAPTAWFNRTTQPTPTNWYKGLKRDRSEQPRSG